MTDTATTPSAIGRVRDVIQPALRVAVDQIEDERMRLIAGYQLGWWEADGTDVAGAGGGKAVRPTFCVLSAEAAGDPAAGVASGVALELVHNFSLLHDDIMDRDVERRHRPTGWVVFGDGQAILAGNAMLTAAIETMLRDGERSQRVLPQLMSTVQTLISGQSQDLALEQSRAATLDQVLHMEHGKTAALISCATSIGAAAAGADEHVVTGLAEYGRLIGLAFQLVDDVLGIVGDPHVTGKSASSDLRAGKRSVPVVAALTAGSEASRRLAEALDAGPLETDEQVAAAAEFVQQAGGIEWAGAEARRLTDRASAELVATGLPQHAIDEFEAMSRYLVARAS